MLSLGVAHPIVLDVYTVQEGSCDFQPHGLVEGKELFEELLGNGDVPSVPDERDQVVFGLAGDS